MTKEFVLTDGTLCLVTEAPGGIYNSVQLNKIAALCEENAAIIKVTEDQRLALFAQPDQVDVLVAELQATGLGIRNYQSGLHQATTCLGEMCSEHKQNALASAMELTEALREIEFDGVLKIGINGCGKCCVPTHTLDISIVGEEAGYRLSMGGKTSQVPELASFIAEGIPQAELPYLLRQVVDYYKENRAEDESLQEMIERVGLTDIVHILAPYSQDAAAGFSDAPSIDESGEMIEVEDNQKLDQMIEPDEMESEELESGEMESEELEANELTNEDFDQETEMALASSADEEVLEIAEESLDDEGEEVLLADDNEEIDQPTIRVVHDLDELDETSTKDLDEELEGDLKDMDLEEIEAVQDNDFDVDNSMDEMEPDIAQDPELDSVLANEVSEIEQDEELGEDFNGTSSLSGQNYDQSSEGVGNGEWELSSFSLSQNGALVLSFATGASMELSTDHLAQKERNIKVGSARLKIYKRDNRVFVEMSDGIKIGIPMDKAA